MNKIAIIDDNLVFRKVTKMLLKKIGVNESNILLFKNGNEMYEFMQSYINNIEGLPKTLFLDLNMPVMDGWDFLKLHKLFKKKYNYNPKIYILTSSIDNKDYDHAMKFTNIEGYLTKPINEIVLTKIIDKKQ
ncbi:response regulator [Yeosuana marina]|uniref:response regulator n=1 Tax=Yeosuana marina TaxID=1565536 RepID=UPI0030EDA19A|tara:strand:- start:391 stop:786 length:396 start_codon:yes stop_codon:yes gene_type:complete